MCSVEGCDRKHNAHGLCATHGLRLARHGDVHHVGRWVLSETGICSIEACHGAHWAKGLCAMHYARHWRKGTTDLRDDLICVRCGTEFQRPYKSSPDAVRFCSHECRYADQLQGHREDPDRRVKIRAWRERNPDQFKIHLLKREASKRGNQTALITARDLRRLVARFHGKCAYCQDRDHEHFDHVIPLARGGRHAIGNLLPACSTCNLSKGARLLADWRLRKPLPKRFRIKRAA